jgi:hypothetical protein
VAIHRRFFAPKRHNRFDAAVHKKKIGAPQKKLLP